MDAKINALINSVVKEYAKESAKGSITAMKNILEKNGIDEPYSIYELKENALCLIFEDNSWVLATVERSDRRDIAKYEDITEACKRMLSLLGAEKRDTLIIEYENEKSYSNVSPSILKRIFDASANKIATL